MLQVALTNRAGGLALLSIWPKSYSTSCLPETSSVGIVSAPVVREDSPTEARVTTCETLSKYLVRFYVSLSPPATRRVCQEFLMRVQSQRQRRTSLPGNRLFRAYLTKCCAPPRNGNIETWICLMPLKILTSASAVNASFVFGTPFRNSPVDVKHPGRWKHSAATRCSREFGFLESHRPSDVCSVSVWDSQASWLNVGVKTHITRKGELKVQHSRFNSFPIGIPSCSQIEPSEMRFEGDVTRDPRCA